MATWRVNDRKSHITEAEGRSNVAERSFPVMHSAKGCCGAQGCTWMKDSMSPEKSLWLYWEQGLAFRTRTDLPDCILGNTYTALHCETMASIQACNKHALHFHAHTVQTCTQGCCLIKVEWIYGFLIHFRSSVLLSLRVKYSLSLVALAQDFLNIKWILIAKYELWMFGLWLVLATHPCVNDAKT